MNPALAVAHSSRGGILRELGRADEAASAFRLAMANGDDTELTRYYLASVDNSLKPRAAPQGYVEALFDDYANDFDRHLVDVLGYRAHDVLARKVKGWSASFQRTFDSAVDLGCGTGLCGALVKPVATHLVGVDLSAQMMDKARSLDVYDELVQSDVTAYLASRGATASAQPFDLIVAADVLIYSGDLSPLMAAARLCLAEDAPSLFCFSVELSSSEDDDFVLLPSLRYAHSEAYLRRLAAEHRFRILELSKEPIREDQRESIPGLYVYLTTA